jgi:5-methylthioribose kinase
MEYLQNHIILRNGLILGNKYEGIGRDIGSFIAKSTFFSSGLHLKANDFR